MTCINCGAVLPENAAFCTDCGARLTPPPATDARLTGGSIGYSSRIGDPVFARYKKQ